MEFINVLHTVATYWATSGPLLDAHVLKYFVRKVSLGGSSCSTKSQERQGI